MRKILILERENLAKLAKLKETKDINIDDFIVDSTLLENADVILFHCSLLDEYSLIKKRTGLFRARIMNRESLEEKDELLNVALGVF